MIRRLCNVQALSPFRAHGRNDRSAAGHDAGRYILCPNEMQTEVLRMQQTARRIAALAMLLASATHAQDDHSQHSAQLITVDNDVKLGA
jgi:hypothetical protein